MAEDISAGPKFLVGGSIVVELVRPGSRLGTTKMIQDGDTTPPLTSKRFSGVLDNVGEFGIVATLEENMGQKFYPWSSVLSISPSE